MNPVLIQPLSISGYQFTFTSGGADIWVSCISPATPLAFAPAADRSDGQRRRTVAYQPAKPPGTVKEEK